MPGEYPLPSSDPASLGFAAKPLDHLDRLIKQHIEEGRYPGAQIALARHGQLALFRTYGDAKTEPAKLPATNDNLFLLFSQTKVLTSSAVWTLVEEGRLSFMDRIADHLPEFAARGKAEITLHQVMTHQGGFPVRRCHQGKLDRPRADARRGLRLLAGLDAGIEAAIPRPGRASGAGDGDRGGHRPGLSRRDPRQGDRAARPRQRHLRRRAGGAAGALRRHLRAGGDATTRRVHGPPACRAAAGTRPRAAWRRSTRCCSARAGWAMCGCFRRG